MRECYSTNKYVCHNSYQILTDFRNSSTATVSNKFAIERLLNIKPNLKRFATISCEINCELLNTNINKIK